MPTGSGLVFMEKIYIYIEQYFRGGHGGIFQILSLNSWN